MEDDEEDNALAPRRPPPFSPEKAQNELLAKTGLKPKGSDGSTEYHESKAMFFRG
jgi:hypothetical protein